MPLMHKVWNVVLEVSDANGNYDIYRFYPYIYIYIYNVAIIITYQVNFHLYLKHP